MTVHPPTDDSETRSWAGDYDPLSDPEDRRVLFAALDSFRCVIPLKNGLFTGVGGSPIGPMSSMVPRGGVAVVLFRTFTYHNVIHDSDPASVLPCVFKCLPII